MDFKDLLKKELGNFLIYSDDISPVASPKNISSKRLYQQETNNSSNVDVKLENCDKSMVINKYPKSISNNIKPPDHIKPVQLN